VFFFSVVVSLFPIGVFLFYYWEQSRGVHIKLKRTYQREATIYIVIGHFAYLAKTLCGPPYALIEKKMFFKT
jgi:hypothetical protein